MGGYGDREASAYLKPGHQTPLIYPPEHARHSFHPGAGRLATVLAAPATWFALRTPKTPIEAARRICDSCGLFEAEVDRMVDDMRHSTLGRDQLLDAYRATCND